MTRERGFALIELIIVLAVISILFSIATPKLAGSLRQSSVKQCAGTRKTLDGARVRFSFDTEISSPTITQLVSEGYIEAQPRCTARGRYVWVGEDVNRRSFCSIHGE